jgi:hypothetical protein
MKKQINNLKPTDVPPQQGGIYFLISKSNIIKYIGMSEWNVYARVLTHDLTDMKVKILKVRDRKKIRWYERRLIQKYKPIYNKLVFPKRTNYLHNPYQS